MVPKTLPTAALSIVYSRADELQSTAFFLFYFFYFYLYIYPPDSQESDGGAVHRVSNYSDLLPEMPRYCCLPVI